MMTIAQRIAAFEAEQALPYQIPLTWDDYVKNTCCNGKSLRLADEFKRSGFATRQRLCLFKWEDCPLPTDLLKDYLPSAELHQYVEILIPETDTWIKLDASWDPALANAGFTIATWDGMSDTPLAVTPLETLSPEESSRILADIKTRDQSSIERILAHNGTFFNNLNNWLKKVRETQ